jgi:hypothetical protein
MWARVCALSVKLLHVTHSVISYVMIFSVCLVFVNLRILLSVGQIMVNSGWCGTIGLLRRLVAGERSILHTPQQR